MQEFPSPPGAPPLLIDWTVQAHSTGAEPAAEIASRLAQAVDKFQAKGLQPPE